MIFLKSLLQKLVNFLAYKCFSYSPNMSGNKTGSRELTSSCWGEKKPNTSQLEAPLSHLRRKSKSNQPSVLTFCNAVLNSLLKGACLPPVRFNLEPKEKKPNQWFRTYNIFRNKKFHSETRNVEPDRQTPFHKLPAPWIFTTSIMPNCQKIKLFSHFQWTCNVSQWSCKRQ